MENKEKQYPVLVTNEDRDKAGILWNKPGFVRDPSVWTKTKKEKEALRKVRSKMRAYKFYS